MKFSKIVSLVLLMCFMTLIPVNAVKAAENPANEFDVENSDGYLEYGCGEVWSEPVVDGWQLSWESNSFFDTLTSASNEEYNIVYNYDENGYRESKCVNGEMTYYSYDESGLLLEVKTKDYSIVYTHDINENGVYITGFIYDNNVYKFVYNEDIIMGISANEENIAEYQYMGDMWIATMGLDENGNWIDLSSEAEFVGNINPVRYTQTCLDNETGWYYNDRYYSPAMGRFIDGVSPERADELMNEYPMYEVVAKTYTTGKNINLRARESAPSQLEAIARVIRLESPTYGDDQKCVAWVIENRVRSSEFPNDAYSVISQWDENGKQFTVYESTKYQNFSEYASGKAWTHALKLAEYLYRGAMDNVAKPSGYNDQLYFSSVASFMETTGYGSKFVNSAGVIFSDCFFIPYGYINATNRGSFDWTPYYSGGSAFGYNVFCNKDF